MKKLNIRIFGTHILLAFLLIFAVVAGICDYAVPEIISVYEGDDACGDISLPFVSLVYNEPSVLASALIAPPNGECVLSCEAEAVMFGIIPIKSVEVNIFNRIKLYPGGMTFGVKLYTDGVMLVGMTDVITENGSISPAYEAGLRIKDVITKINGTSVTTVNKVIEIISKCEGKPIVITVRRSGSEYSFTLNPAYSTADTEYKAGIWIRDSAAGIGTVTYINPADNTFAGLGHGITDVDTGELMPLLHGTVSGVAISSITKGREGLPGELMGYFTTDKNGALLGNTKSGIYGLFSELPDNIVGKPLPIAIKNEIKEGPAVIYSTDGNNGVTAYDVIITGINKNDSEYKNFIIEVTDPDLIELTGGIIQGMSGSPVIQNDHIIGAVTHVMINNPKKGYGIFIENMLRNMPKTTVS
ncbi:MAG: SpoIVB peptidase [Eubacteriales bacterium]